MGVGVWCGFDMGESRAIYRIRAFYGGDGSGIYAGSWQMEVFWLRMSISSYVAGSLYVMHYRLQVETRPLGGASMQCIACSVSHFVHACLEIFSAGTL